MKSFIIILFCGFIAPFAAEVVRLGKCPSVVKPQDTFDVNKYLGDWYEIVRFPAAFEGKQTCVTANYQLKEDGHIRVDNSGYENGEKITAIGDGFAANPDEAPAKLQVRFSDAAPYANYWVLDTDYDTYTLVYSCADLAVFHIEYSWILSRKRTLDSSIKDKLYEKLQSFKVDTNNFLDTDQSNCPS